MRTASIFVKKKLDKNTDHFLDNSQIHYLKKVLKLKKDENVHVQDGEGNSCLLYTSPSPRDKRQSRMPSSA